MAGCVVSYLLCGGAFVEPGQLFFAAEFGQGAEGDFQLFGDSLGFDALLMKFVDEALWAEMFGCDRQLGRLGRCQVGELADFVVDFGEAASECGHDDLLSKANASSQCGGAIELDGVVRGGEGGDKLVHELLWFEFWLQFCCEGVEAFCYGVVSGDLLF